MTQKVLKVGSSAAVTIPKRVLQELALKTGDRVTVTFDKERKQLSVAPAVKINDELLEWTRSFIEQYRPALEELAKK